MEISSVIIEFTRFFLAGYFTFVAVFYAVRMSLKKRAGIHKVVYPGETYSLAWWNYTCFRFFRVAIWAVCVFRCIYPGFDSAIGYFHFMNFWPLILLGNLLLVGGFFATMIVHMGHGASWRSGIDPKGPDKLITEGFYKYSRNPMFLCIAIAQLGFFLAMPSVFSAICLMFGWCTLYGQTIAEENSLMVYFPDEYARYLLKVRRWISPPESLSTLKRNLIHRSANQTTSSS